MTYLSIPVCFLLLAICGRSEAFSHHKTISVVQKPNDEFDYLLGPEFFADGSVVYAKVKKLDKSPASIKVSLETFGKKSSTAGKSFKNFSAEPDRKSINVTSMKTQGNNVLLSVLEQQENGKSTAMLVLWDPFTYPNSNLHLPENHILLTNGHDDSFDAFINGNETCHTPNGKCRVQFLAVRDQHWQFLDGDLDWSTLQIARDPDDELDDHFFIRGFDAAGNFKFILSQLPVWRNPCAVLLTLPNANKKIDTLPLDHGLCYVENPGKDTSAKCLLFDLDDGHNVTLSKTITRKEPISLVSVYQVKQSKHMDIYVVTKPYNCKGTDCFNLVISKIQDDKSKPITHRNLSLECSDSDELVNVSLERVKSERWTHSLVIDYICENKSEFSLKSATINDE